MSRKPFTSQMAFCDSSPCAGKLDENLPEIKASSRTWWASAWRPPGRSWSRTPGSSCSTWTATTCGSSGGRHWRKVAGVVIRCVDDDSVYVHLISNNVSDVSLCRVWQWTGTVCYSQSNLTRFSVTNVDNFTENIEIVWNPIKCQCLLWPVFCGRLAATSRFSTSRKELFTLS